MLLRRQACACSHSCRFYSHHSGRQGSRGRGRVAHVKELRRKLRHGCYHILPPACPRCYRRLLPSHSSLAPRGAHHVAQPRPRPRPSRVGGILVCDDLASALIAGAGRKGWLLYLERRCMACLCGVRGRNVARRGSTAALVRDGRDRRGNTSECLEIGQIFEEELAPLCLM